jgi:hypothetical protein
MSRKENLWYVLGVTVQGWMDAKRPRSWQVGLWLLLLPLFLIGFQTVYLDAALESASSPAFVLVFALLTAGLAVAAGVALQKWRQNRIRRTYVRALQQAGPEGLNDIIVRSMKSVGALPDADAFSAQSRAIAYALYGREEDATNALAEVNWGAKAPLIQATGVSAEGIVELLCRRDPQRALELHRRARALAAINPALPGAAQTERYHGACVAVSEVLANAESASSSRWLEQAAADKRFPPLQLLASFGLAIAMDRSGNAERARQLRAFIIEVAPHCRPLQLKPADFAEIRGASAASRVPVTGSPSPAAVSVGAGVQERAAKRKLIQAAGRTIGLWAVLILMFLAMWAFLAPAK